jgi:hypothetical protein
MISHRVGLSTLSVLAEHCFFGSRGKIKQTKRRAGAIGEEGIRGVRLGKGEIIEKGFEEIYFRFCQT